MKQTQKFLMQFHQFYIPNFSSNRFTGYGHRFLQNHTILSRKLQWFPEAPESAARERVFTKLERPNDYLTTFAVTSTLVQ